MQVGTSNNTSAVTTTAARSKTPEAACSRFGSDQVSFESSSTADLNSMRNLAKSLNSNSAPADGFVLGSADVKSGYGTDPCCCGLDAV